MSSMSSATSDLLLTCGFKLQKNVPGFSFDLPGREKEVTPGLIHVNDEGFELLFPYRYPAHILQKNHISLSWHPTWEEVDDVFTRLLTYVTENEGDPADTAWYLYAYIACPRMKNADFAAELFHYTDTDLLELASIRHLPPTAFAQMIEHLVPVNIIQTYDINHPLSLFLELYPSPDGGD